MRIFQERQKEVAQRKVLQAKKELESKKNR